MAPKAIPGSYSEGINEDVTITIPAGTARNFLSNAVLWSYSADPTTGRLSILGGGFNIDVDITRSGPGWIPFTPALEASNDTDIVITLHAAGVAGCRQKLNLLSRFRG